MRLVKASLDIDGILEKALDGQRISEEEGLLLLKARGDDLLAVALAADRLRKERAGDEVTYVVNRNINFTNICIGKCRFCAFRRESNDDDAYFMDIPQVAARAREAKDMGATEVCIQGGLHPDVDVEFYAGLLNAIKENGNSLHTHAYSPMEIYYAARQSGISIRETLEYLKKNGLDSIPGTAAEILDDAVRETICPGKISSGKWVDIVREAHMLGIPTTATMLYGHVESPEERMRHLAILRDLQDETNGFTEFVPLSFVHFNTPLFHSGLAKSGATGIEDLLVCAVSRIFLDNFRNIQASWIKLGRKFAQVMLNFGANDLGGTLMEENISRAAGIRVEMATPEELQRMILDAGREPVQRDTLYNAI
ncbi:MAG: 5-amino-6-(D-ribitylamino)uracil--L-tyrosine 4-hydroxyphenyl transferase CofH [Candidatus Hydrothermarchaeales archaeon]